MKRAINNQVSISVKQIMKVHSIITGNVFILPLPQQAKERQRKEEGLCQIGLEQRAVQGPGHVLQRASSRGKGGSFPLPRR